MGTSLRRAVPTGSCVQVPDVELEKSGMGENLPAFRTDMGQVDEERRIVGDRTATPQFSYGLEA